MITCKICGKECNCIPSHLYPKHHISTKEYLNMFPDSELISEELRQKSSGKNNHFYGKKHSENSIEKMRQASIGVHPSEETIEKLRIASTLNNSMHKEEYRKKVSESVKKSYIRDKQNILQKRKENRIKNGTDENYGWGKQEKNPVWNPDRKQVYAPYTELFRDENYRDQIMTEQNSCCGLCRIYSEEYDGDFQLHHVDYDKQNDKRENLIFLCNSCHAKTNYNRKHWINIFSKSKIKETIQ